MLQWKKVFVRLEWLQGSAKLMLVDEDGQYIFPFIQEYLPWTE